MVCKLGNGRMAVMERLFASGGPTEITADEARHEKVAVQMLHRAFHDADEANLLDEEDMHIFDSRPLTDPLHLVCCNTCKKPVKTSQYAPHAERCVAINSKEQIAVACYTTVKVKRPPRKGREKQQAANINQCATVGRLENSVSVHVNENAVSESRLNKQIGLLSSLSGELKIITAVVLLTCLSMVQTISGAPAPLATKIYHSQGSRRLRLALGYFYHEASSLREHGTDSPCPDLMKDKDLLPSQISSSSMLCSSRKDNMLQKMKGTSYPRAVHNPDQTTLQNSESCLTRSRGLTSPLGFSSHFKEKEISRPGLLVDTVTVGLMRTR